MEKFKIENKNLRLHANLDKKQTVQAFSQTDKSLYRSINYEQLSPEPKTGILKNKENNTEVKSLSKELHQLSTELKSFPTRIKNEIKNDLKQELMNEISTLNRETEFIKS